MRDTIRRFRAPKFFIHTFEVERLAEWHGVSYIEMRYVLRKAGWVILPTPHRSTYE